MRRGVLFLTFTLLCVAAEATEGEARAEEEVHELKKELVIDIPVTGSMLVLGVGLELAKAGLVPENARWSDVNEADEGARDLMRWKEPKLAGTVSDVFLLSSPFVAIGTLGGAAAADDAFRKAPVDALIVVEAASANVLLNQVVKFAVARERPYGHYPTPLDPLPTADARLSFYSGHTSTTFCLAAASGTVAYLRGYQLAPLAWIPGATMAALTGYLRIAADKHYFTDVITGALVGSALGIFIPLLFHGRVDDAPAQSPSTGVPSTTQAITFGSPF